jgi:hypothetical protein
LGQQQQQQQRVGGSVHSGFHSVETFLLLLALKVSTQLG